MITKVKHYFPQGFAFHNFTNQEILFYHDQNDKKLQIYISWLFKTIGLILTIYYSLHFKLCDCCKNISLH
jgi:hypothetical protein